MDSNNELEDTDIRSETISQKADNDSVDFDDSIINLETSASGHLPKRIDGSRDGKWDDDNDYGESSSGYKSLEETDSDNNSELLREASAAAVQDAIAMKRSDSILSELNDGKENDQSMSEGEDNFDSKVGFEYASQRYMEEASVEASLLSPNHHRLALSGRASKKHSSELSKIVDLRTGNNEEGDPDENDLESQLNQSESAYFLEASQNSNFPDSSPLETINSMASEDNGSSSNSIIPEYQGGLYEIMKSVGLSIDLNGSPFPDEVVVLHALFKDFSKPSLDIEIIDEIWKMEQKGLISQNIELPTDVVIHNPADALFRLMSPSLLQLSREFALSLFRILLRLLTNGNDAEYNSEILATCAWYDDISVRNSSNPFPKLERQRTSSVSSLKKQPSFSGDSLNRTIEARKADQLYSVVRLQRRWSQGVTQIINLLKTTIEYPQANYLLPPITRLLGLLCTSSVSVEELRRIIALSSDNKVPPKTRLLLIRALNVAATGAARSSLLVGKASPRNFFSFSSGEGISRPISLEKAPWPFKNDFGAALWFRAEHFSSPSTLLRVVNENESGIEVALLPLSSNKEDTAPATVLAISILESGKAVNCVKVSKCILHARVWYHVAIRHTRSRLKGVFSLKAREQISVMLDGKTMLSEPLKFPQSQNSKTLSLTFGASFDGQTGSLYVFHENVSDATLKALYGLTAGTNGVVHRRDSVHGEWDSRRGDIVRKSKVLDLNMRRDDVEEIVLSQRVDTREMLPNKSVADLDEEDENVESAPLSKGSFNSRLYLVWDPQRTEGEVALELHCGAHARMDPSIVKPWEIQSVQDVIGSLGGVQVLLPICRSFLGGNIEKNWPVLDEYEMSNPHESIYDEIVLCSIIPSLLSMLASFVRDHSENAREILRCGGIDIFEQLLYANKKLGSKSSRFPAGSLMASLSIFPSLASRLVESLLELRSASSHYVGLESKVFSRLLFNIPLWFGGHKRGIFLFYTLFPVLSSITSNNPEKVRDCVGINDMVHLAKELVEFEDEKKAIEFQQLFARGSQTLQELRSPLTRPERRHVTDILAGMIFQVLGVGSSIDSVSHFFHLLSQYLEAEWEAASSKAKSDKSTEASTGVRDERHAFSLRACTSFLFLLQARPMVPHFIENFAGACGSVQAGAAWILSSMVNSYCDEIRSLGIRCIICYLERTASSPDQPLALGTFEADKMKSSETRTIQENTLSLISNVGQGFLNSNVGKGLAALGPAVRSKLLSPSMLTARVVYKLMWHLLKFHRYRMSDWTQASLLNMVCDNRQNTNGRSMEQLKENFIVSDDVCAGCVRINMEWAASILSNTSVSREAKIRDSLGVGTVMRLLRFLPGEYVDQWLGNLFVLVDRRVSNAEALSRCADWQSCLFHLISEIIEKISASYSNQPQNIDTHIATNDDQDPLKESKIESELAVFCRRLDLSLDLYAGLLAHRVREGGDKALATIEDCASLQRVCLNGQEVFTLILSRLIADLSRKGVVSLDENLNSAARSQSDEPTFLLKRSASLVTEAILSNGTDSMNMPEAVGCWRGLRHLTAITVAAVTQLGFGVTELFDYSLHTASAVDEFSGGLHGTRLADGNIFGITAKDLCNLYSKSGASSRENSRVRSIFRSVCVTLSAQILSLLDVFVFPDSLDASSPASQLHGLALVRSTETRVGSSQGPLLNSLIRLSLLLLCHLEPCSVKLLQCSSRLRCFLYWVFELVRESEALEGYSAAFNKITAPFDRLVLAVVLQCHRTLGRCGSLLSEIESTPFETYFESKEAQKKSYRRLIRVSLELRDILVTVFERRNEVLRASLSSDAYKSIEASFEVLTPPQQNESGSPVKSSQKEVLVRSIINSDWVTKFQDVEIIDGLPLPEQLKTTEGNSIRRQPPIVMDELMSQSKEIVDSFEKALNVCFEKYLESQRQWAETGAVRDLEFEGDTTLRRLAGRQASDAVEFSKTLAARGAAAEVRWRGIERKVLELWNDGLHWKLARYTDRRGRRITLVRNRLFDDHSRASYDLMMGMEREKEEKDREERMRKKQELSELMKRNTDAFIPKSPSVEHDDEFKDTEDGEVETDDDTAAKIEVPEKNLDSTKHEESEFDPSSYTYDEDNEEESDFMETVSTGPEDIDAWAKAFIWSDSESVVARFNSVMIVTLQYLVEGNLLLTTHGLYFHGTGDEINSVTKEPLTKPAQTNLEDNDRRWRLSRLTEVHGRRYMLRAQALELFFSGSHELFLNFLEGSKERNRFYAKLRNSCKVPMLFSPKSLNPRAILKKSNLTDLWKKRKLSNFEYIMALNRIAGRTFNDIAQYPVFPWILSDYESDKIDLRDSRFYRDLSKPVGALNPNRLAQLLERYNELEQFGFSENEKFLYGSHYSSPGVVLHYLIRQEPFTSMAIDLQSGRFDCPDRLFFDLAESWRSCNTSSSDVKELIPEFFTLPEMFLNSNNFPLGRTQRGRVVGDVGLPPWAKGSAHEFVRLNRLALESEHVSRNLHNWIDLVFGFKQRGQEAEAAHNIFHHLSYEGSVDLDKISDEVDRNAAESHIQNFGQTPSQLLTKEPHPIRMNAEECWIPLINNMSSTVRLRCHTPSNQYGGKKFGSGSVAKIYIQADSIIAIYSDLRVGGFKWFPKASTHRLRTDKLKALPNRGISNSRSVIKRGSAAPQTMDDSSSRLAVGNWSFAVTIGGYEKEQLRRKSLMPSRLVSAKDALYMEASPMIVSCGYWDNTIKVHSMDTWRIECSETGGHRGPIRCIAVGEDGGLMVSGGEDCTCRVWVLDHPDMAIALSDGYVQTALGQSTDGDRILSCCHVLWGHDTPIACVDLSSDLDIVVSGSVGGRVCVHTLRRGEYVRSIHPPSSKSVSIEKVALDSHGRMVVHTNDGGLFTYTVNGHLICSTDSGERLHDLKISGEVLITGGDRCHVYIRDLVTLKVLSGLDLSRHGPIRCLSLTPDELNPVPQHLFIGSDDGMISIVDRDEET